MSPSRSIYVPRLRDPSYGADHDQPIVTDVLPRVAGAIEREQRIKRAPASWRLVLIDRKTRPRRTSAKPPDSLPSRSILMSVATSTPLRVTNARLGLLVRVVGSMAVLLFLATSCASSAPQTDASALGYVYESLEGKKANFSDQLGRPLVVNFFASWCAPCVREMPDIEAVHNVLGDKVAFLGLSVQNTVEQTNQLVSQTGVSYAIGRDPTGELLAELGGRAMPTTAFIDGDGKVLLVQSRTFSAHDLEAKIRELFNV